MWIQISCKQYCNHCSLVISIYLHRLCDKTVKLFLQIRWRCSRFGGFRFWRKYSNYSSTVYDYPAITICCFSKMLFNVHVLEKGIMCTWKGNHVYLKRESCVFEKGISCTWKRNHMYLKKESHLLEKVIC